MGYQSEKSKEFSATLNDGYEKIKQEITKESNE